MDKTAYRFLAGVLGTDGAKALGRAVTRQPELATVLIPRTVLGWLGMQKSDQYEGAIPGIANSYLSFTKTESGWTGAVSDTKSNNVHAFSGKNTYSLAATICAAIGFSQSSTDMSDASIVRLGKSIDALLKAHDLTERLSKTELPGRTHKPTEQTGPEEPEAPQKQPQMKPKPKLPKLPTLKVEKAESGKECPECGGKRFMDDRFVGCMCWRDLAKSIKTVAYADGYVLEFSKDADRESIMALAKEFR